MKQWVIWVIKLINPTTAILNRNIFPEVSHKKCLVKFVRLSFLINKKMLCLKTRCVFSLGFFEKCKVVQWEYKQWDFFASLHVSACLFLKQQALQVCKHRAYVYLPEGTSWIQLCMTVSQVWGLGGVLFFVFLEFYQINLWIWKKQLNAVTRVETINILTQPHSTPTFLNKKKKSVPFLPFKATKPVWKQKGVKPVSGSRSMFDTA